MSIELKLIRESGQNRRGGNEPVIILRAHHFTSISHVRAALASPFDPELIAKRYVDGLVKYESEVKGYDNGYLEDFYGETDQHKLGFLDRLKTFFSQLRQLKDNDFLELGLKMDGMCYSCNRGNHCDATNYQSTLPPRDVPFNEKNQLEFIKKCLIEDGSVEGLDFMVERDKYFVYDYEGRPLNSPVAPLRQEIVFANVVVRVGALRSLANKKELWAKNPKSQVAS